MATEAGAEAARSAAAERADGPRTETTLTTRVRINIPGSRPIPPVVVRKPVADGEGAADDTGSESETTGTTAMPVFTDTPAPAPEPAAPGDDKPTSDWFAPRKGATPAKGTSTGGTNGAGFSVGTLGGQGAPAPGVPATGPRPGGTGGTGGTGPQSGGPAGPRPGATAGPRPGGTNGAGLPGATGGQPVAPGHGGGTGSFDVSAALAGTKPERDDLPYFSDNGGRSGPAGPTGGPVTGDSPLGPPPVQGGPGGPGYQGNPFGGPDADFSSPGAAGAYARPGGGISDDTAVLTPQRQTPEPGYGGAGPVVDNPSGHTLTSGIPVVPPGTQGTPFGAGGPDGAVRHTPPKLPDPGPQQKAAPAKNTKSAKPAKKKGRSKLGLLIGGVVVLGGGVYGAGLLMNHSDVPKGTTVLGVDIGGGTRDEAVNKLDAAFGKRTTQPLQLSVDGDTVSLTPDQAGLQFDKQATVSAAAVSDYNPVSVIGSLFGQERVVSPVMPVDEEKLRAALERAAGGAGSASDGTVKYQAGKAVPVYGKAGKGIAVGESTTAVEEAYRAQVETGGSTPVRLPTTEQEPSVGKAEVDRFMKEFAQPAMSATVTVQTDPAHAVLLSPQNSLWKFLTVKAVDGKLVDSYDEKALKELYGGAFDGVLITRANGEKTPVTVEDVYGALRQALKSTTNRTATIETNPS
ncbi:conserved hypothetical protein [Streptomyces scabiei 87.22]|uniref:Peptidoglycan binding domain-containing protein n=2 Tax=Streptomyces TaxID=1883 RepID=C9ZBX8_STRSW|nr:MULTISPECIES: hypothetical protein [Streptomyces]MBP5928848.1 hypothetical protein [Streptomyces sp. LBUM 1479]MBP5891202.1 hypothetical protein [Streptomyces sp. LBUM 1481]MBP5921355.1 hypothetical protein [Streptomyces sp. LBUM 1483]MDX2684813.1 hypothetical protein [Streptomyces scabiei]MDX2749828.1 hypothetical protein [Streptomyces scabiei]